MFKSFSELNSLILPLLAYLFPDITVLKVRFVLQNLRNLSRVISVNRCLIFKVHHTWLRWFSSFFASSEAPFLKWALPLYQILLPLSTPFFHLFSFSSPFLQHSRVLLFGDILFFIFSLRFPLVNVEVGFWFEYNMWRYWLISCFFIRANSIGMWFKQRTFFLELFFLYFALLYMFLYSEYIHNEFCLFSFWTSSFPFTFYPLRLVVPPRHLPLLQGEAE